jgi:hypothetical protein
VRVPELVGREPAPDACLEREVAKLDACGGGRPRAAVGRAVDHAEQCPDGQRGAVGCPWLDRRPRPGVHADLTPATTFAVLDHN